MHKKINVDMSVKIAGVTWQNPITTGAGTFSVRESSQWYDVSRLGAVTAKGVSMEPWLGNPVPRIAETYGGMLNAVGLENPGVDAFLKNELPLLKGAGIPVIVNVAGKSVAEYCHVVAALDEAQDVAMLELNISCPNVKEGGIGFGTDRKMAAHVVREARKKTSKPLIVKLSPNVTDICEIAKAAEDAGADALSLINTLLGMRIDANSGRMVLANKMGGLSGPAIKPVALRMVYQVARAVKIPLIGMGGISSGLDAAEFLMAGASAVAVGTAALVDPSAPVRIIEELEGFMQIHGYGNLDQLKDTFKDA